jgi:hypothetical protein
MDKTVQVDYENVDVAALSERIRAAAAARSAGASAAPAPASAPPQPPVSSPSARPPSLPPGGFKTRLKGLALRMLRPLFPLMRLLVLPLHEDVAALYRSVDAANAKTDKFVASIQLLHLLDHNLVVELTKLRLEHEALKSRLRLAEKDLEMLAKRERAVEERVFPE